MSVQFDEEKSFNESFHKSVSGNNSKMAEWLIKKGLAKDENGAKTIMIVLALICFALTIFVIIR
jgi:hypothetical protein